MADETSRAPGRSKPAARPTPKQEFENVEFLDEALEDPLNVLRLKLKDLSDLPDGVKVRRIIIVTEVTSPDGRGLDVIWSEGREESFPDVQDSVIALLLRVQSALVGE